MLARNRLIAAGVATFVIGIAIGFPARVAYNWFSPPELRLSGITGTIWKGRAAQGSANGLYLHDVHWTFVPRALLKGKLGFAIASQTAFSSVRSEISVGRGGVLSLNDLESTVSLQEFSDLFQLRGFEGSLELQFESLDFRDGVPIFARGKVRLSNLLAPQISPLVIGNYLAEFSSNDEGIVGSVEDVSGVLDVAGTISIGRDRSYSFVGKVGALPAAPSGLAEQLQFLGSPDDRGHRDFRIEGQL